MPISKENQGGNYSKAETIQGRKLVYKRIQKGGNYSKEERNNRRETIQGNTVIKKVKVSVRREEIALADKLSPDKIAEFNFKNGDGLTISELDTAVIQFNSLEVIRYNKNCM